MSQSLSRALKLLVELGRQPCSLDDAARVLDVHKTTALRLLRTLEEERFVHRDPSFRYHLGSQFFALATTALDQRQVRGAAGRHLTALSAATGQTVHLAGYEDGHVIYWDKRDSAHTVRMYSRIGLPASPHTAAVAKVLLAGLDEPERRRVVEGITFTRHTPPHPDRPGRAAGRAAHRRRAGLRRRPRRARGLHELCGRPGPGRRRPGDRRRLDLGAGLRTRLRRGPRTVPDLLGTARAISIDCGWSAP